MRLIELLPNFISELQIVCEQMGRPDLTEQFEAVELDTNTYSAETRVAQLRLRPGKAIPGKNEPEVRRDLPPANENLVLRHRYGVRVETDNAGRMKKLVVAEGTEIAQALGRYSPLRQ